MPPPGGVNSEFLVESFVKLPDKEDINLSFKTFLPSSPYTDGVRGVVRVNGDVIWSETRTTNDNSGWHNIVVSLNDYRGQTILLSFGGDCIGSQSNDDYYEGCK